MTRLELNINVVGGGGDDMTFYENLSFADIITDPAGETGENDNIPEQVSSVLTSSVLT